MSDPSPLTVGDLLLILRRRIAIAMVIAVLVAAVVALRLFQTVPLYRAKAKLAVEVSGKTLDFQTDPHTGRVEFSRLNTIRDKLRASPVLEAAAASTNLFAQAPYSASATPISMIDSRLRITTSRDSLSMEVEYDDEDAARGQVVLAAILTAFRDIQVAAQGTRSNDDLSFLSRSRIETETKLAALHEQERQFRTDNSLIDDDPADNVLGQRVRDLNTRLTDVQRQIAAAQALKQQVEAAVTQDPPHQNEHTVSRLLGLQFIAQHPLVISQRERLFALQERHILLSQKYLHEHPRMIEIDQQIAAKRSHLAEAVANARTAQAAHYTELTLQRGNLEQQIDEAETRLQTYRDHLLTLQIIQKEVAATERILDSIRERLAEQRVLAQLEANMVHIFSPPRAGDVPVNIRKALFVIAALMAGGVAGVGAALARELLDRKIRLPQTASDITSQPVIGHLPHIATMGILCKPGGQTPAMMEAMRALRTGLQLSLAARRQPGDPLDPDEQTGTNNYHKVGGVIAITSCCPGDGKSTLSARLAVSLAAAGQRVLLVEADLHQPSLDQQFAVTTERGLSARLMGQTVRPLSLPDHPNLDYLGAGPTTANPAELMHKDQLGEILQRTNRYDWILIDTPPIGRISDALIVAGQVDKVLLVVRESHTVIKDLRRAASILKPLDGKVLGLIYNGQRHHSAGYGHHS